MEHKAVGGGGKEAPSLVFQFLSFKLFSDDSLVRESPLDPPPVPASEAFLDGIASKDVTLDHSLGVWARIFLPHSAITHSNKLPLLLYFHGGGFCFGSTDSSLCHSFLTKLATAADVLIVSVNYRLAPEHRLPAAYQDCFRALEWVYSQALLQAGGGGEGVEPWVAEHADFCRCFLAGDSAGANIAHNVAMMAGDKTWDALFVIQGMILLHPYFSSEELSASELEEPLFTPLWNVSLPAGANRDHPACNPLSAQAPSLATAKLPSALILIAGKDGLRDRAVDYYEALQKAGKQGKLFNSESEGHVFHIVNPQSENVPMLMAQVVDFIKASL